jgi:hypothetical protein
MISRLAPGLRAQRVVVHGDSFGVETQDKQLFLGRRRLALLIKVMKILRRVLAKLLELSLSRSRTGESAELIPNPLEGLCSAPPRGQFCNAVREGEAWEIEFCIAGGERMCSGPGVGDAVDADLAKERVQGGGGASLVCERETMRIKDRLAGSRIAARVEVRLEEEALNLERLRGDELLEDPVLLASERVPLERRDEVGKGKKSVVERVGFLLEMCCHEVWLVGWVRMAWSFSLLYNPRAFFVFPTSS